VKIKQGAGIYLEQCTGYSRGCINKFASTIASSSSKKNFKNTSSIEQEIKLYGVKKLIQYFTDIRSVGCYQLVSDQNFIDSINKKKKSSLRDIVKSKKLNKNRDINGHNS
jgi:hypothetical protein